MANAFYNDLEMAELGSNSPSANQSPQPAKSRLQIMLEEQQKADGFMSQFVDIENLPPFLQPTSVSEVKAEPPTEFREILFAKEPSQPEVVVETLQIRQESAFTPEGEITFNNVFGQALNQVSQSNKVEPENGTKAESKKKSWLAVPDPAKEAGEAFISFGRKAWKEFYSNTKEFAEAMTKLVKENIFYFTKRKEPDPQKAQEEAEKKAKKTANIREFITKFRENLHLLLIKRQEAVTDLEKRLGTAGLSVGEKNRLLGKNRNESNRDIQSLYHLNQTYFGMVEAKKAQKKAQDQQSLQAAKPIVNMYGAIEGGTGGGKVNISTTGGAGVG